MDFLKKHYEKMVLAFFLLIFVFLLLYLIELSKETSSITKKQLEIPTSDPNYMRQDFSHKKYQVNYIFNKDSVWEKSSARSDKDNIYTDLLIPYKCARCPFGNKIIPSYYFYGPIDHPRNCPLCSKALPRPIVNPGGGGGGGNGDPQMDRDNDGIPNVVEIKLGLDPEDPDDGLYDMDNDGFPNVFEYKEGTNIKSSKSHPPYYKRLQLLEFRETLLPFKLKTVVTNNKKDPKDWDVQINETKDGKIKTNFEYLGSSMRLDNTSYKITKIIPIYKEERRGGTIVTQDKSKIMLESIDGKYNITMQVDKDVYSPKPKAVIEDLATGKSYHVGAGDAIVMATSTKASSGRRSRRSRSVKYKVFKVDREKKQVIIEDRKFKKHIITAKALMPKIKQKERSNQFNGQGVPMPGGIGAPPGDIPGAPRTTRRTRRNF